MKKQIQIPDVNNLYSCDVLVVNGDITSKTLDPVIRRALALHMADTTDQVSVIINSCGGSLSSTWQLVDILMAMKRTVVTYCLGDAYSSGAILYLAGDIRVATPRSSFMLHQYSWGGRDKYHELKAGRSIEDHTHKVMYDYVKDRAGESAAELLNNKSDVWLTPKQAKKHGIVHKVVKRVNIPRRIGAVLNGGKDV